MMPEAYERVLKTNSIEFVKDALTLSKDLQPCINIDALFCLTNMMNIKELKFSPIKFSTFINDLCIDFIIILNSETEKCKADF